MEARNFLEARAIDSETAMRLGINELPERIEFSYSRNGNVVYKKFRSKIDKTFFCEAGNKPFFFNFDVIKDETVNQPILITEGEFDCVAAIQAGHIRSVSVPNGSQGESASLEYLDEVEDYLLKQSEIILAFDNDDKGHELLQAFSMRLGKVRCKWLKYPDGCKDLNDVLLKHGVESVRRLIANSAWVHVDGVYKMSELPPLPYMRPYSIGIDGFEKHLNLRMGDFSVWTGVPSSGKSTFLNDVVCRMYKNHGLKSAIASFEQNPQQDHKRALRCWYGGKPVNVQTELELQLADNWIDEAFNFIVPDSSDKITLDWFFERAAVSVVRHNCKIIVLDPWNEMEHQRINGETMTEYTGYAIRKFKDFAKKYQVHVAIVAHPAKLKRDKDGDYPIPSLYDISDSAHWYNKADLGVIVHRATDGDFVQIAKSRYHHAIGTPAVVDVRFNLDNGRYMVVDNDILRR